MMFASSWPTIKCYTLCGDKPRSNQLYAAAADRRKSKVMFGHIPSSITYHTSSAYILASFPGHSPLKERHGTHCLCTLHRGVAQEWGYITCELTKYPVCIHCVNNRWSMKATQLVFIPVLMSCTVEQPGSFILCIQRLPSAIYNQAIVSGMKASRLF